MGQRKFLGEFEHLVLLAVLRLHGDGYGMSIRRELEDRTGRSVSIGALYATLDRLESKGFIASRDGAALPVRGGRARRHFRILVEGSRALAESRGMLDRMWEGVEVDADSGAQTA